jgi:hypothetical protein
LALDAPEDAVPVEEVELPMDGKALGISGTPWWDPLGTLGSPEKMQIESD